MEQSVSDGSSIAIIGMAGRFPGAGNLDTFWQNLRNGVESIHRFSREELLAAGVSADALSNPLYVPARSILDGVELFDADFFNMQPREAELTDPQHRIMLELAWEAFENAGYVSDQLTGSVGVFAGSSLNTYFLNNLCGDRHAIEQFVRDFQTDGYQLLLGTDKDYLATRLSYKLNLKGPSITVQTACSTSLVAICQACQSLLAYQCDVALAGGVSISFPQHRGHVYQEGAIGSFDGHCRSFDKDATGTVFGSGAGLVMLKRLDEAIEDGDHIHAVIKGFAVNNDGAGKVSYTAPSVAGQAEVIALAHAVAGITAESVSYVEAHGTATPLGDPIEMAALTQAFRTTTTASGFCHLGSLKTNLGHLETAAGVAGLIKTTLALENGQIPPSLHFKSPNPKIAYDNSPFRVVTELTDWKPKGRQPRRAGVSSFGVGGTNAHVVLEESPVVPYSPSSRKTHLLLLSARSEAALETATENLRKWLQQHPQANLSDVAYTLQVGRRAFNHRRMVFATDVADAITALGSGDQGRIPTRHVSPKPAQHLAANTPLGDLAQRWLQGEMVRWPLYYELSAELRHRIPLPTYPFQRQRYWVEPPVPQKPALPLSPAPAPTIAPEPAPASSKPSPETLLTEVKHLLASLSGLDLDSAAAGASLFELGFDSLVLTQAAHEFRKRFGVKITFRQLLEELTTLGGIVAYLDLHAVAKPSTAASAPAKAVVGRESVPAPAAKAFGPYRPIEKSTSGGFTERQQRHLNALIERTVRKTPESKRRTQRDRQHFADPRSVSGFRVFWKEMVYPIITVRSAGSRFWDVDGNEYIDVTMGFGTNLLGHAPAFITEALESQLKTGIEVGPQSPIAGEVAKLMCELTGHERAAFCNTGSEAVLAAARIARTVTGRTRIATTSGFHGINDEVLVRAAVSNGQRRSLPVAPGIPQHIVDDVLVLDYGTEESLDLLQAHANELAAVFIEPVQSRRPDLQPRAFLQEARRITRQSETALIFDEVINGFRIHLNGAQAFYGVQSDIGTWGKIIGGGMPIGAVTGSARFMDALDGGHWQYGDDSFPEVGVTFFAGTYVRHPLAMAASHAILSHLKEQGPGLQQRLAERTKTMIDEINAFAAGRGIPLHIERCASLFYFHFPADITHGSLLWFHLREKGLHIWEGRPCFLSTAHTDEDVREIIRIFKESLVEMQQGGFLPGAPEITTLETPATQPLEVAASSAVAEPARAVAIAEPEPVFQRVKRPLDFSLYFFGNYPATYTEDKYDLILDAARFADTHQFKAIWLPERHFHAVGGFSPNPSVLAAALSRETTQLQLRGGSVVLPLHHPVRVAEEWSMVDNLSGGRVGMSIASGWHPNDFVFAPTSFEKRRELNLENLGIIQKLWRGETVNFPTGGIEMLDVALHPLPKQRELPVWLTCIHKESFVKAGELGVGVLGYLMNQSLDEVQEKIAAYHQAFAKAGHDPARAQVTILLHTFIGKDVAGARSIARRPLREYLRSFLDNSQKRIEAGGGEVAMEAEDMEYLLDRAFDDYSTGKALIGSPESCAEVAQKLAEMGVDEIGCFLDFGVEPQTVLDHLPHLVRLKELLGERFSDASITLPLTQAQAGLRMIQEFGGEAERAYVESCTLTLRGALEVPALQAAFDDLIHRHEALRTSMSEDGTSQLIHPEADFTLRVEDISELPTAERLHEIARAFETPPLRLTSAPLFDACLVRIAADHHQLLLRFHHLLGNGPSYWIFFEELTALYEAAISGDPVALETPLQLRDYVRWREAARHGAHAAANEAFWLDQFSGELAELELPADHPRPARLSFRGGRVRRSLDAALTAALRQSGAKERSSLFMMLFAAWQTLLHRLSGQLDFTVASPFESGARELPGGSRLFANTTNMVPFRVRVDREMPFTELLARTKSGILAASEHQELFFGQLLPKLGLRPDPSRSPLFNAVFNYETGTFSREASGVKFELITEGVPYRNPHGTTIFDLGFNIAEQNGSLLVECDFNRDLFEESTITRWLEHYETLLQAVAENPAQPLAGLPILSDAGRHEILVDWNATQRDYPSGVLLHELFEQQAAKNPDAIALIFDNQRVNYRSLNEQASRLANHLRQSGVQADSIVAVLAERSVEMVVALLATLKAGGAYLPLDPGHPRDRIAFMLADAKPVTTLAQRKFAELLPESLPQTMLEQDFADASPVAPARLTEPDHLAYVIYTSGSTGQPKGAMNTHRAIVNRLLWMQEQYHLTLGERVLQKTPYTFDVSVWEFFWPLLAGATLVVAKPGLHGDSAYLVETIRQYSVTTLHFVPSMLAAFLHDQTAARCGSLKRVICSGEALPAQLKDRFFATFPLVELHNLYGPTEAAVDVTYWPCTAGSDSIAVPIGRPVANTQIHLLDASLQPVPIGVTGELHIGGVQLARGYLGRPELTAEKFIPNPFGEGRLYKTGDLARYRTDGAIEFLGRLDHQIKLRGFRIELGEIEAALKSHSQVSDALVLLRDHRLVAYVIATAVTSADLGHHLKSRLPDYMVPAAFVSLAQWPLTANGKLDRRALPGPDVVRSNFVAASNELEKQLTAIWREVLEVDEISVQDNFFELGGDSLLGLRVVNRLRELTGEHVSLVIIFEAPTIRQLAALIEKNYRTRTATNAIPSSVTVEMVNELRSLIAPLPAPGLVVTPKLERAIFILSPMRSGSTLTRIMLSAHPTLFAPPELQLLQFETLAGRQRAFEGYDRYMLEGTLRAIMEIRNCNLEEAKAEIQALETAGGTVPDLYRQLQSLIPSRILVDKTPDYAMQFEVLQRAESWFENVFYIHLVRHPLGMMRSYERGHFILESPYRGRHHFSARDLAEMTWQISHENILAFLKDIPQHRQHRLSFESLVRSPRETLSPLCEALGLPFHPAMLDPHQNGRMTDGVHPMAQQVGDHEFARHRGLESSTTDAWRRDYSEELLSARTLEIAQQLGCLKTEPRKPESDAIRRVSRDAYRQKRSLLTP